MGRWVPAPEHFMLLLRLIVICLCSAVVPLPRGVCSSTLGYRTVASGLSYTHVGDDGIEFSDWMTSGSLIPVGLFSQYFMICRSTMCVDLYD